MVEQLHAKGYLKDEVHKAQVREINDQLRQLKRERQCEFSSGITHMIEELTRLKKLLEELEEPLDRFDEKLFSGTPSRKIWRGSTCFGIWSDVRSAAPLCGEG